MRHGRIRRRTRWSDGPCFLLSANPSGLLSLCHDFAWLAARGGEILFEPIEAGGPGLLESGSAPLLVVLMSGPQFNALETVDLRLPDDVELGEPPWEEGSVVESRVENGVFYVVGNRSALVSLASHAFVLAQSDHGVGDAIRYHGDRVPLLSGSISFAIERM